LPIPPMPRDRAMPRTGTSRLMQNPPSSAAAPWGCASACQEPKRRCRALSALRRERLRKRDHAPGKLCALAAIAHDGIGDDHGFSLALDCALQFCVARVDDPSVDPRAVMA